VLSTLSFRLGLCIHDRSGVGCALESGTEYGAKGITLVSTNCLTQGLTSLVCPKRYNDCLNISSAISFGQSIRYYGFETYLRVYFFHLMKAVVQHFDDVLALVSLDLRLMGRKLLRRA